MKTNRGCIQMFSPFPPIGDGLERRNPLIVALGDSVTAGHFESTASSEEDILVFYEKAMSGQLDENDIGEVTDVRESYVNKFYNALIDWYEQTSLSVINCGIAGDDLYGMNRRVYRDVIRYAPDLILINASLNWGTQCGSTSDYENELRKLLTVITNETNCDIILLTPNMDIIELPEMRNPNSSLAERVEVIRKMAAEFDVCLADTYKAWKEYEAEGYPVDALLANGCNHPSITGHEAYARVLMKLIK
jgi:lysophospholipase L1-like esterase